MAIDHRTAAGPTALDPSLLTLYPYIHAYSNHF